MFSVDTVAVLGRQWLTRRCWQCRNIYISLSVLQCFTLLSRGVILNCPHWPVVSSLTPRPARQWQHCELSGVLRVPPLGYYTTVTALHPHGWIYFYNFLQDTQLNIGLSRTIIREEKYVLLFRIL